MKKLLLLCIIVFAVMSTSCNKNRNKYKTTILPTVVIREDFAKEVLGCIDNINQIINIETSELIFTVDFFDEAFLSIFEKEDTVVTITYLTENKQVSSGYKGLLIYEGYPIVIFDKKDRGKLYYDEDILFKIPLNILKSSKDENNLTFAFVIKDGVFLAETELGRFISTESGNVVD